MIKFNIMAAKPYTDAQGQQKTKWVKLGSLVEMVGRDGTTKRFGDLDSIPAGAWFDGTIQLFEQDTQQQQGQTQQQQGGYNNQQQYQGQNQQQQPVGTTATGAPIYKN